MNLQRIEELFQAAADLDVKARAAFLDRECGGEPVLRERVEELLAQLDRHEELVTPALAAGPGMVALSEGPGTVIDRYELLEPLGEGGFGIVYRAEQRQPVKRQVALKVIKWGMDTREVVARFEAERQALALMDHPAIAKVLDGGATPAGRPFFVMELVPGLPITDYCDRHQLDSRERLELFIEVCAAVQHAHQKGVLHRDLKPSNVVVAEVDGKAVPKVIDFGIAKAMHTRLTEQTALTEMQRFLGTPAYMSPEQASEAAADLDTRADVYSLGVLLYELLTGVTPFETAALVRGGLAEIQRILREERPPRPSLRIATGGDRQAASRRRSDLAGLSKRLRGDLDWIVMKALEKERERRYGTVSDLAADLGRHLRQEPVEAGPPSRSYRLRKALARNRAAVAAAAAVVLALAGGAVAATLGLVEAARQRDAARSEAAHARAVTEFLVDTLALTDPEVALRPDVSVRTLLDRAASQVADRFEGRPEAEARVRATIGRAYASLSQDGLAEVHLRRAVEKAEEVPGFDRGALYAMLWQLTHVTFRLERDDAYAMSQRARRVGLDHLGASHPEPAALLDRFYGTLWEAALEPGAAMPPEALKLFRESVEAAEAALPPGDPLWLIVADVYMATGFLLWYSPHEPLSEHFYSAALEIQERELGSGHPEVAKTLGQLVGVLNRAGRAPEAEERIRASVEMLGAVHQPGSFQLAVAESLLGDNLVAQGRFEEAEPYLLRSHTAILRTVEDPSNFFAVDSVLRLLGLYEGWGRAEEATGYREELARIGSVAWYPLPWPMARPAFGPSHAELLGSLDRLEGALAGPEAPEVVAEALGLSRASLCPEETLGAVVGRWFLLLLDAAGPEVESGLRQSLAEEAERLLRPWAEQVPVDLADALAQQADLDLEAGDRAGATSHLREALTLLEGVERRTWPQMKARVRVGRGLLRLELFDEAEALLRPAHGALAEQLGTSHSDTVAVRELLEELEQANLQPTDSGDEP